MGVCVPTWLGWHAEKANLGRNVTHEVDPSTKQIGLHTTFLYYILQLSLLFPTIFTQLYSLQLVYSLPFFFFVLSLLLYPSKPPNSSTAGARERTKTPGTTVSTHQVELDSSERTYLQIWGESFVLYLLSSCCNGPQQLGASSTGAYRRECEFMWPLDVRSTLSFENQQQQKNERREKREKGDIPLHTQSQLYIVRRI